MKYRISKVGEISKDLERKQGHLCTKKNNRKKNKDEIAEYEK